MRVYRILKTAVLLSVSYSSLDFSCTASVFSSSWMRKGATSQATHSIQALTQSIRFCSSLPHGMRIASLRQNGLAPSLAEKRQKTSAAENPSIDIAKFCADNERGLLYRFQSWQELAKEQTVTSDDDLSSLITELAATDEELAYLTSNIKTLKAYPLENLRAYIPVFLDIYRKGGVAKK